IHFPHSLGLLYSAFTFYTGFKVNSGEYKVMGLAPFGAPRFADALREIVQIHDDGSVRVDERAVGWWSRDPRRLRRVAAALEGPPRRVEDPLEQRQADIARSVQHLIEEAVLKMGAHAADLTGESNVCLAGGVALNAVANGRLLREGPFEEVWVQPAAGDAGSAIGAALWYWHHELGEPRDVSALGIVDGPRSGSLLGPQFGADEIERWLVQAGVDHRRLGQADELDAAVADELADGAVVGWFQGRMEFGPRALGNRSILADARSPVVHQRLNVRIKGRESFRPFAPAVLWEDAGDWFDLDRPLPHMTTVVAVSAARMLEVAAEQGTFEERAATPRSEIPACTHVDGSARVQTVHREINPRFHALLSAFRDRTGCPVLLNTSFNVRGEPIVCTPDDALRSARSAHLDLLVLEDCLIDLRGDPTPKPRSGA
ncbi:MAG: hypothetical protein KDA94_15235, partial [Acidimicrobiales bacterium]|nr:hypothetical protein [Acidimicrobiales bacterium]